MFHVLSYTKRNPKILNNLPFIIPLLLLSMLVNTSFSSASTIKNINIDSLKKEISNAKSSILIVDFWATWCSPCKKQLPILSNLYEKYRSRGLSIIGVAMDYNMKDVKKFVRKSDIRYPVYVGGEDIGFIYKLKAVPTTHIYDRNGNLVKKHTGFVNEEELTQIIENILEAKYVFNNSKPWINGLNNWGEISINSIFCFYKKIRKTNLR